MGEVLEFQPQIIGQDQAAMEDANCNNQSPTISTKSNYRKWFKIALYAFSLLAGQATAVLLGRLYYNNGGNSKWVGTLLQFIGFPILLIPLYSVAPSSPATAVDGSHPTPPPPPSKLALIHAIPLGLLLAMDGLLFSMGLKFLPLSTFSILISSHLAFNAIFSFLFNYHKFTSYFFNSLVLLTFSSLLLWVDESFLSSRTQTSKGGFVFGFVCTICASAGVAWFLSLMQFVLREVIKSNTIKAVINLTIYISFVASIATAIGLIASGEWKNLKKEMEEFQLGKVSYIIVLLWTAISWQVYAIGSVGLSFGVSSNDLLISNSIGILSVPVASTLGAIVLHEKMTGVKVVAMALAIWGLSCYVSQRYLEDISSKEESCSVAAS